MITHCNYISFISTIYNNESTVHRTAKGFNSRQHQEFSDIWMPYTNEVLQDANLPVITEQQHEEFFMMIEKFDAEMSPPK
jgi:hypothetical protein